MNHYHQKICYRINKQCYKKNTILRQKKHKLPNNKEKQIIYNHHMYALFSNNRNTYNRKYYDTKQ